MKTTWLLTSLFISSVSLATTTNATTMDTESVDSNAVRFSTNSNDRYNNLDDRSNSMSSPAYYGAEENHLGEAENSSSRMTGGSSGNPDNYGWEREAGNPTTDWESGRAQAPSNMHRTTGSSSYEGRTMDNRNMHHDADRVGATTTDMNRTTETNMNRTTDMTRSTGGSTAETHHMNNSNTQMGNAAGTGVAAGATAGMTAQDTTRAENETEMVRRIRSEITSNSDLSVRAHNVKIINQNGQIYLKGPVANTMEKSKVEDIAKRMAGNTNVVNQTYVDKK